MPLDKISSPVNAQQSLTSTIADKLREQIIRGEIPEETRLQQDVIAAKYHVSRIPVREALRQLDAEGLISIVPNRGAIIPKLSSLDIEELFSIRALLEPAVLELSIPRLLPGDFAEAEEVLRRCATMQREPERESQIAAWGRLNLHFHFVLYSRADKSHFMSIIRNLNHRTERYSRLHPYLAHDVKQANEEHHQILELCKRRNVEMACELLCQHIRDGCQRRKKIVAAQFETAPHTGKTWSGIEETIGDRRGGDV